MFTGFYGVCVGGGGGGGGCMRACVIFRALFFLNFI